MISLNFIRNKETDSLKDGVTNLIVGWSLAKEFGASIRNHKISDNVYWTFSSTEKRKEYETFMEEIYSIAYNNLIKDIKIKNLNPLDFETKEEYLNEVLRISELGKGYLYEDRLYIYKEGVINHIDVGLLDFMSWDIINNILGKIELIEDSIENFKEDLKYLDIKYIPYLIYAKQNDIISNFC